MAYGTSFSSVLRRPTRPAHRANDLDQNRSPSAGQPRQYHTGRTYATADFTEADDDDDDDDDEGEGEGGGGEEEEDEDNDDEEDNEHNGGSESPAASLRKLGEDQEDSRDELPPLSPRDGGRRRTALPILPLFSASHLDSLPVYNMTHAIRIIVCARTETTLTWDQLRSPQVSQFLVKPMQQQIRTQHFSRSTLYALMANCLQFSKEGQRYAANAGTSNTRAKVCELLALKLLKEYSTRELIDALAYDFYPLQGLPGAASPVAATKSSAKSRSAFTASRTSTLEVAIRASAKHFLAHPVVIQQLEAIWSGAISFYSSADNLHREDSHNADAEVSVFGKVDSRTPLLGSLPPKDGQFHAPPGRRTVMLYDPRQTSMLKLSRLRVPRYRSFLSTLSLAVLIGLFLAVLVERSVQITGLELVFWFWSAGFMLDELVGFNEQGFALYIMSFWNVFDLGILALLIVYYCMRIYGVFLVEPHPWNDMAYDVLAANAILLLPRIFSILDHYQYFSQLLIAFRLMAVDLAAVFVLVLIACSGFYVFFTLSNTSDSGAESAYKIFQILMGFTPAAWDVWPSYNWVARILLVLFLIICHFLVATTLITVLTNSFMAIASNATEEHQFLFAINTISMVKNDALFSYIAPSNIFAWLLIPLRYCMPLRQFVSFNRTIIKITHFPILFCIYLYERFWLASTMFEPTDLVENPHRSRSRAMSFGDLAHRTVMFSPNVRVREESVAGFQKDRALEELFRRGPGAATLRSQRRNERRKTQTAIRNWMDQHDDEGGSVANWPTLDSRAVPDWQRRLSVGWERTSNLRQVSDVRSIASDPADFLPNSGIIAGSARARRSDLAAITSEYKDHTDADGDDELLTNDEEEDDIGTNTVYSRQHDGELKGEDYFTAGTSRRVPEDALPSSQPGRTIPSTSRQGNARRGMHNRTLSTNTILYNPEDASQPQRLPPKSPQLASQPKKAATGAGSPVHATRRSSPRRSAIAPNTKSRPIMAPRGMTETGGVSRSALLSIDPRSRLRGARRLSSVDLSMLSGNTGLPFGAEDPNAGMPGSFQTQMAMAMMKDNQIRAAGGIDGADRDRMGRLVLARMRTLEESFAEVIREMRDLKNNSGSTAPPTGRNSSVDESETLPGQAALNSRLKKSRGDWTPKKAGGTRPVSRKSMKEGKVGLATKRDVKGKGKEAAHSSDESLDPEDSFVRKGSSM